MPAGGIDQCGSTLFRAGRGRVEVEIPCALLDGGRAGLGHRHGLARGHRRDDEIRLRGEVGMRGGQCHAVLPGVVAQGTAALVAAKLDVISGDLDLLLAQVLRKNASDLAIADQADIPLLGVGGGDGHGRLSVGAFLDEFYCFGIFALSITARHLSMSDLSRSSIASGEPALASMPSASNFFLVSASAKISCNATFSVLMTSGGVPVRANSAFHDTTSYSATPLSCTVASSGVDSDRTAPEEASALSLPSVMLPWSTE